MKKIVLIGGMPRSGTNLARRIIGSHSMIAMPAAELWFFRDHQRGRSVAEILSRERLSQLGIELSDLERLSHREAYLTLLQRYAEQSGKSILGEKTPLSEFYFDTILTWLKEYELKFIHLVRNPFDTVASYKHAPFRNKKQAEQRDRLATFASNWRRSASIGLALAYSRPEQYRLLTFEALTADPGRSVSELCQFIGVEAEAERMVSLADFKDHQHNTSFARNGTNRAGSDQAVHRVESRKHHLTPGEVRLVAEICGEVAWAIGYSDEDFKLQSPERPERGMSRRLKRLVTQFIRPSV